MPWWSENRIRMVQNNMRDIDGAMDVDRWVADMVEFGCNTVMFNVGGVTTFYPTALKYQSVTPYLPTGEDKVAEIVSKSHAAGLRVIGRFDFNRAHERFYEAHKDWFFHDKDGHLLRCNDTVTTCLNSWYQQEYAIEILKDALDRYALDGIFFNGFGFASWDYSGNDYGPCHCEACKRRFAAYSGGLELPDTKSPEEPSYEIYEEFKRYCITEMMHKIIDFAHCHSPEVAVCTYTTDGVDIVRNESNCTVGKPYPFLLMQSATNVEQIRHTHPELVCCNCVINATDMRWRYAGVATGLTELRLYEEIAAGGSLDFCTNGPFEGYPDQASLHVAKTVFQYHRENERYYGCLQSQARIAMVRPAAVDANCYNGKAQTGLFRALKEEHLPFDIVLDTALMQSDELRSRYALILLPDAGELEEGLLACLYNNACKVIAMNLTAPLRFKDAQALGVQAIAMEANNEGAYWLMKEKSVFPHFKDKDWMFAFGAVGFAELAEGWTRLMPYMKKGWFGPAERAFGTKETADGGVFVSPNGCMLLLPWNPGALYAQYGYPDHKWVVSDLIDNLAPEARILHTNAHASVELFWDKSGDAMLLQALNLSGFNGTTVEEPVIMPEVRVTVPYVATTFESLKGNAVELEPCGKDSTTVVIHALARFAAVALRA